MNTSETMCEFKLGEYVIRYNSKLVKTTQIEEDGNPGIMFKTADSIDSWIRGIIVVNEEGELDISRVFCKYFKVKGNVVEIDFDEGLGEDEEE